MGSVNKDGGNLACDDGDLPPRGSEGGRERLRKGSREEEGEGDVQHCMER